MVVGLCFGLLFFFVPETFWDRTPRPKSRRPTSATNRTLSSAVVHALHHKAGPALPGDGAVDMRKLAIGNSAAAARGEPGTIAARRQQKNDLHVGFAPHSDTRGSADPTPDGVMPMTLSSLPLHDASTLTATNGSKDGKTPHPPGFYESPSEPEMHLAKSTLSPANHDDAWRVTPSGAAPKTPGLHSFNSPFYLGVEREDTDYLQNEHHDAPRIASVMQRAYVDDPKSPEDFVRTPAEAIKSPMEEPKPLVRYTTYLKTQPPKTFAQALKPWNGRLRHDRWLHVAFRPFILFAYPAVLWSAMVYSLSVGWLIVLSESVSTIYRSKDTYNFSALGTGLIYLSPFVGGVLGTAVAGKVSDIIIRFMSRRNGGIYEPEFRLVMAGPVAVATCIGLMGFGWSAAERDRWIVPTIFFGIISFGCSLGSTTAITFCVDSYRQYAGEALVTLNFSKSQFLPFSSDRCTPRPLDSALILTESAHRYLPWPRLLPLLQPLARGRRLQERLFGPWRHPARLFAAHHPHVCLRQAREDVDCAAELDGEVLMFVASAETSGAPVLGRTGDLCELELGHGYRGGAEWSFGMAGWSACIGVGRFG